MTKLTVLPRAARLGTAALGACALALVVPSAVFASNQTPPKGGGESTPLNLSPSSTSTHTSGGGASILRTIIGLAIVIAVIWGLAWILKKVKAGRDPHVSSAGLTSIAALTLSSGRSVHLVRAGSEYVLLGSAEHGVVPIHRYTEEEARDAGLLTAAETASPRRRSLSGPTGDAQDADYDPTRVPWPSASLVQRLREWTVRR
jgi:flagellar protein FliO/FliZ